MTVENKQTIKVLFFGDLVGKSARNAVRDFLAPIKEYYDFVIVNGENASHGFGLTKKNYENLLEFGVDCITSGNHIWDKKEIWEYIDTADKLVRPLNYPKDTKGEGWRIFETGKGVKIGVINFLGTVFMSPIDSPWRMVKEIVEEIKKITPIVIVDFHAEATAEKICFGRYCSEFGVSAFFGTHTHVQTADEKILNNMAYITDAGFCGTVDSIIGMKYESSVSKFLTCMPERYDVAEGDETQINAVEVEIDINTGYAVAIKRISCNSKVEENKENEN